MDLGQLADLCTPWCMHAVATLRIAERIAAGTTDIGELAVAAGADAESLARVVSRGAPGLGPLYRRVPDDGVVLRRSA